MANPQITIQLTRDDLSPESWNTTRVIGEVVWRVDNEAEATGEIVSVKVPGDRALERELRRRFKGNPEGTSISGGTTPDDIGQYAEGVRAVLALTALDDTFDAFDFSDSELPVFDYGPDRIG